MSRRLKVAAGQVGRVDVDTPKEEVAARMIKLLNEANDKDVKLVVFPELTFTTFFARHLVDPESSELDKWFEQGDIRQDPKLKPFFDCAKDYGIAIYVGYGELTDDGKHYNSSITIGRDGEVVAKYRKVHIPGDKAPISKLKVQHMEKRYFVPGDLGFEAFRLPGTGVELTKEHGDPICGMLICNDRRWCEAWRAYGLQGVEIMLIGYNTPNHGGRNHGFGFDLTLEESEALTVEHHNLSMQYNAYANSTFAIGAARCGSDDGIYHMIGMSSIVSPSGRIIAQAKTTEDELVCAEIDLDDCVEPRRRIFDFDRHRRPEVYQLVTSQQVRVEPPRVDIRRKC